jgi:HEAT repeat protein
MMLGLSTPVLAQAPGPELFAKEPRTPLELWEAADYLVRTGQARKAVPYLERFQKSQIDDATWVTIRDRYGVGSVLRLQDDPATQPFAQPAADALSAAAHRYATRPDRIARFIVELTKTPEEQDYAVRHLQEAGPYAVPFLVEALQRPGLSAQERALLVRNIGRLDRSAIPALAAVLDSPDPDLAAGAATALGLIGDPEALPFLMFPAASASSAPTVRAAAQEAVARITGKPFSAQPGTPVQVLTAVAWRYHRDRPQFPEEPVVVWTWDDAKKAPAPRAVPPLEANTTLGLRLASEALRLDPSNRSAQVARLSLVLDKAAQQAGPDAVPARDPATFAAATAAGPSALGQVLETAIADGKVSLAAVAALALAKVTDRAALAAASRPHPLVQALTAPGRRAQFTAAKAIVDLAPDRPFPGSSLVVPALARFLVNDPLPRAIVIDSNISRGSRIAGLLMNLGYHPELEATGSEGFRAASETADVELILVGFDLFGSAWNLTDALTNLQADARTAGVPLFVYGPYDLTTKRPNLERDFPGVHFVVTPADAATLERELKGRPSALTPAERAAYAREAAVLLDRIAREGHGPMAADVRAVEPALSVALIFPETVQAAASALSELPDPSAQRSLADLVLDPSRPSAIRAAAAALLVRSIRRFKPLITARQEARIAAALDAEADPAVQAGLAAVVAALKPVPAMRARPSGRSAPVAPAPSRAGLDQPGIHR